MKLFSQAISCREDAASGTFGRRNSLPELRIHVRHLPAFGSIWPAVCASHTVQAARRIAIRSLLEISVMLKSMPPGRPVFHDRKLIEL